MVWCQHLSLEMPGAKPKTALPVDPWQPCRDSAINLSKNSITCWPKKWMVSTKCGGWLRHPVVSRCSFPLKSHHLQCFIDIKESSKLVIRISQPSTVSVVISISQLYLYSNPSNPYAIGMFFTPFWTHQHLEFPQVAVANLKYHRFLCGGSKFQHMPYEIVM